MKATTLRTDIPATTLSEIAKTEKSGAVCRRLLGLAHLLEGGHRAEAQRIACLTTCTFRGWMKQFNDEGIAGLYPRKSPGRPSRMSQEVVCKLKEKVLSGPSPEEGLVRYRIVDLQTYLEKEHQISFGISRIWYVLQDLNISWKTARQRHPKSDEQAQEAFKKTSKMR